MCVCVCVCVCVRVYVYVVGDVDESTMERSEELVFLEGHTLLGGEKVSNKGPHLAVHIARAQMLVDNPLEPLLQNTRTPRKHTCTHIHIQAHATYT